VLVVLLSLISIGFARLMNRAVNNSLNNQLSSSASYAAQSALNDAIAYVQVHPTAKSTTCNGLFTTNGVNKGINPNYIGGSNSNYKYSCILVNPTPPNLEYSLPSAQSQVATINTVSSGGASTVASNLLLSWQAGGSDASKTNVSACAPPTLYDETTWSTNGCPPLLRMTLYPVDGNGNIAQANSRTFFFYPTNSGGNTVNYSTQGDGSLIPVNCNSQPTTTNESTGNYQCSVLISNFTAASGLSYFYARMTSIYDQADVQIKADDSSNNILQFKDDQSLIDATAQAGTASKRLQSRVVIGNTTDIVPSEDALPEAGLRSADAICKQLDVTPSTVLVQGTFCSGQQQIIQPPVIYMCVDNGSACNPNSNSPLTANIADSSDTNIRWNITGTNTSCNTNGSSLGWNGPSGNSNGSIDTGALSGGTSGSTYTYVINCSTAAGNASEAVTVNVAAPTGNPIGGSGPPVNCSDLSVNFTNFSVGGGSVSYSVEIDGNNPCGETFSQCNLLNSGGGSLAELDGNGGTSWDNTVGDPGGTSYMSCQTNGGAIGYSNGAPGSGGSGISGPGPQWISKGIKFYGPQDEIPSSAWWCGQPPGGHSYFVCGLWETNGTTGCTMTYDGQAESVPNPSTNDNFSIGFANSSQADQGALVVDCSGPGGPDIVWSWAIPNNVNST
jgi:hypothetical protein